MLLINLQGTATSHDNVGNHEVLTVASVAGSAVTFAAGKTRFYGDNVSDDTSLGFGFFGYGNPGCSGAARPAPCTRSCRRGQNE